MKEAPRPPPSNPGSLDLGAADSRVDFASERIAGRYEVIGLIGVGGMGSVYRVRDLELDEVVALKRLRTELVSSDDMLARFRQEVKLARRVTHRNVARTFDIGEHAGEKFLTMEHVEGESLAGLLQRRRALPVAEAVSIACDVCAGLSAAHAVGVVHRDLKPDNVLIAKDGRAVITDFGIARALERAPGAAATQGLVIGTPQYMAPEQVQGGAIDGRTDVYAAGEILFEMLTGSPPWTAGSIVELAAARLSSPPPDPRRLRPDLPDALAFAVQRAMARRPEDRYATADELAGALSGLTLPQVHSALKPPPSSAVVVSAQPAPSPTPARATSHDDKTVAVLLFRNGGAPDDAYLAEGLTEDLIDALSAAPGIRVRAFSAILAYRESVGDPRALGQALGVSVIVDGSVRRAGDSMRVSARILSVEDGFQLWARRFDRPVASFLQVGDEIADAIGQALLVDRQAAPRSAPTDPAALELYLRARHELKLSQRDGTLRALTLFSEALRRAPKDPVILSGFAIAQVRQLMFGDDVDGAQTAVRETVEEATRIAPDLPEPHLAVAALDLLVGRSESAARELTLAMKLGRPSAEAHDLMGSVLLESGPLELAAHHMELAVTFEPRLYHTRGDLPRVHWLLGNEKTAQALIADAPDDPLAVGYWIARARGTSWRRDVEGAKELLAMVGSRYVRPPARFMLDVIVSRRATPEMHAVLGERIGSGRSRRRAAFFTLFKAEFLAYIGELDHALRAALEADAFGSFDVVWFDRCPLVEALRDRPEFQEARARVETRAARVRAALGV